MNANDRANFDKAVNCTLALLDAMPNKTVTANMLIDRARLNHKHKNDDWTVRYLEMAIKTLTFKPPVM